MMTYEEQICLEDLQGDLTGIQERLDSTLEPFVLTKEGRPIAILQNLEGYYHIHKALLMLKILSLGEADIQKNNVRDQDEVFESLKKKIGEQHATV